jgi:hypothetical protein
LSFRRSNSGLSNLHLFYRVDAVVFVEGGGRTLSFEEVAGGAFNEIAHDAKFWSLIFRRLLSTFKFKFRAVGSKSTLLELASLVVSDDVANVVICMDRDLDNYLGRIIRHPRIAYTHGYSWENDAWSLGSALRVFRKISCVGDPAAAISEIKASFATFGRQLRWPLLAHALLVSSGILEITTADLEQTVVRGAGQMPALNCARLRSAVRDARVRHPKVIVKFPNPARFSVFEDCYGHLLATFAFHTVAYALRKHCNVRAFGKDVAASVAIEESYAAISANKAKKLHYVNQALAVSRAMSPVESS